MRVLVTGGAGFVGSALVPALIAHGHDVIVLDVMLFGNHLTPHPQLQVVEGDIRTLPTAITSQHYDALIHLACIANDPSWELDPAWGKAVNYDALGPLVAFAKDAGVTRFIYASSSSVYGTKPEGVEVTEKLELLPLTDYSKYKALGEDVVLAESSSHFTVSVLRPATVCGYSARLRLDVVVNQMTADAWLSHAIAVHGGRQYRANLHIDDMVRAYISVLQAPTESVEGQVFNVGAENVRIMDIAHKVAAIVGGCRIDITPSTNDPRSYTLNADKIQQVLNCKPTRSVNGAIHDVLTSFKDGRVANPADTLHYNLKRMQELCLTS